MERRSGRRVSLSLPLRRRERYRSPTHSRFGLEKTRYSQSLNDILPRCKNERSVLDDRLRKRLSGDEDEARLSIRSRSELDSLLGRLGGENDGSGGRVGLFRVADEEGAGEGVGLRRRKCRNSG